jgi:hypothetical protein
VRIDFSTNELGCSCWSALHDRGTIETSGGARRDRTDDLLLAKQALSQLSYGPFRRQSTDRSKTRSVVCRLSVAEPTFGLPSRSSRAGNARLRPLGYGAAAFAALRERRLVGLGRFELPTSRLSSARSNQLSYKPNARNRLQDLVKDRPLAWLVREERETETAASRKWTSRV